VIYAGALITFVFGIANLIDAGNEYSAGNPAARRTAIVAAVYLTLFAGFYAAVVML
jgi:hypothetical protein